jgi:hypothetical protein
MTPRPPALVTAAASLGPAATFMPASMMGCWILKRSVMGVRICSVFASNHTRLAVWSRGGAAAARGTAVSSLDSRPCGDMNRRQPEGASQKLTRRSHLVWIFGLW